MSHEKPPEFRLRLSPELKAIIEDSKGSKSINALINEWLWRQAKPDDAVRLANALRSLLQSLDDADRALFLDRAIAALEVLTASNVRRSRRRSKDRPRPPSA